MKLITLTNHNVKLLTHDLISYTSILEKTFTNTSIKPENSRSFFDYVKKDSEPIFNLLQKWETELKEFHQKNQPLITISMMDSTIDNMTALIMHSYYKDVRRRRYMEIKRSCLYTFQSILKEVDDES